MRRLDAAFTPSESHHMNNWPHSPPHRIMQPGTYMITCGTYRKDHLLARPHRLDFFLNILLDCAREFEWELHAWAILSNHYHFVGSSREPTTLKAMISKCHTLSAREYNREDQTPGRKVWFQYFDSLITFPKSYYARLNYVHYNPVHHGVTNRATEYRWCSAGWFETQSKPSFLKTVQSFKINQINAVDAFNPRPILKPESGVEPPHSKPCVTAPPP